MNQKRFWVALGMVMVVSFAVLGYFGREVYRQAPPIPCAVVEGVEFPDRGQVLCKYLLLLPSCSRLKKYTLSRVSEGSNSVCLGGNGVCVAREPASKFAVRSTSGGIP